MLVKFFGMKDQDESFFENRASWNDCLKTKRFSFPNRVSDGFRISRDLEESQQLNGVRVSRKGQIGTSGRNLGNPDAN